jgi:hypothetical protein
MVCPGTLFHRRQRGIPMQSYENMSQIQAVRVILRRGPAPTPADPRRRRRARRPARGRRRRGVPPRRRPVPPRVTRTTAAEVPGFIGQIHYKLQIYRCSPWERFDPPHTALECQVPTMATSDVCPRPTAGGRGRGRLRARGHGRPRTQQAVPPPPSAPPPAVRLG